MFICPKHELENQTLPHPFKLSIYPDPEWLSEIVQMLIKTLRFSNISARIPPAQKRMQDGSGATEKCRIPAGLL